MHVLTNTHRRAPAPPELTHSDEEVHSLVDVDSPHISSVPSDYEEQKVQTSTQQREHELEDEAKERADKVAQEAKDKKDEAKKAADKAADKAKKNSDNPVVLSNVAGIAAMTGLLGYGAYRKYHAGELTWKLAGAWAGVVGLFAVADYYTSQ